MSRLSQKAPSMKQASRVYNTLNLTLDLYLEYVPVFGVLPSLRNGCSSSHGQGHHGRSCDASTLGIVLLEHSQPRLQAVAAVFTALSSHLNTGQQLHSVYPLTSSMLGAIQKQFL